MTKYLSENAFNNSPYKALKVSSYFETYDLHLKPYFGKPVTVVEVGVLHGGSLFMWRELFGPQARIIGIDLNPNATKWRKYGFEIYIGNQESPTFWSEFFGSVGNVDIVLDDGAHTNRAHLVTLFSCIPKVNNGGLILIEDTHTDFEQSFGNPSIISISNIGRNLTQLLTTYGNRNRKNDLINPISSIAFHESIIVFRINYYC